MKCPQFLMSRPRVTDLFLQDVHKSQLQDRLQTVQVEERWIVGAEAAEGEGTVEQKEDGLQRCQDMTHSSPDCNYRIPERGNVLE